MKTEDIFTDLETLETDRIILRKLIYDDEQDIYLYGSDHEVSRYTTWPNHRSIEDTRTYLNNVIGKYNKNTVAPWGIMDKKNKKIIGTAGFMTWSIQHSKAELGYALSRDYWNKGYMTEVVSKIISFGFEKMKLVRIEAFCHPDNTGSSRVMEKCGMKCEGTLQKYGFVKGKHIDLKVYSIIKEGM